MYSDERQSTRSPTASRTDSYRDGPTSRTNGRAYQTRSSIVEENGTGDNEYEEASGDVDEPPNVRPPQRSEDQYIAALRYRFPNRPKSDYSYSKPPGPPIPPAPPLPTTTQTTTTTTTTTPRTGPYQSTLRPTTSGANTTGGSDDRTFPRPALRPVNPEQQNTYARRIGAGTTTPTSPSKPTTLGPSVQFNESNIDTNRPGTSTFNRPFGPSTTQQSIFEQVPSHGGPVSYLGIGTFSQFEHCLRECLERERRMTGMASHITRHDLPPNVSVHDYDYNHILSSPSYPHEFHPTTIHHEFHPTAIHHEFHPTTIHQFTDYPSRPMSTFSLDDIRYINVALSRSGIPLFPYHRPYYDSYPYSISSPSLPPPMMLGSFPNERHATGEVVSACRVVEEDPAIMYNGDRIRAVQNVWNAIQNYRPLSYVERSRSSVSPRGLYDF